LSIIAIACAACQSGDPLNNVKPIAEKMTKSQSSLPFEIKTAAAYKGGNFISVYIAGETDVLVTTFEISSTDGSDIEVQLGDSDANSITHFSGPHIVQAVLPAGAVPPLPPDHEYTERKAVSGLIRFSKVPMDGISMENDPMLLAFSDVRFEDGSVIGIEPMKIRLGVFPP